MKRIEEFRCSSFLTPTTLSMKIRPLTGKRIPLRYTGIKKRTIFKKKLYNSNYFKKFSNLDFSKFPT